MLRLLYDLVSKRLDIGMHHARLSEGLESPRSEDKASQISCPDSAAKHRRKAAKYGGQLWMTVQGVTKMQNSKRSILRMNMSKAKEIRCLRVLTVKEDADLIITECENKDSNAKMTVVFPLLVFQKAGIQLGEYVDLFEPNRINADFLLCSVFARSSLQQQVMPHPTDIFQYVSGHNVLLGNRHSLLSGTLRNCVWG